MGEYIRTTPCGQIAGTNCQWPGVEAYKGIRYATAGRWEYPVEVTEWDGIYQAKEYGKCSFQPRAFYDESKVPEKAFYYNEFRKGETYIYDEDCLFLNIWTPENSDETSKLPVIFYIHGGGFVGGCGHEKHFDGPVWPTINGGVVAVTINYRLGPMGFVALESLKEKDGFTGNYGLFDQLTALKWVHHNIASFGGDPENITLMGQSAGAMSVQQHCMSPLSDGLIAKAVMSSGSGASKLMSAKAPEDLYEFWNGVMAKCDATTLEEFKSVPPEKLFAAWTECKSSIKGGGTSCFPVIDGRLVIGQGSDIIASGKMKNIPYIVGINSEDIMPPIFYKMTSKLSKTQAKLGKKPAYQYFFDRRLPGDDNGAWHSSDLWYWFGTLKNGWRPFDQKDEQLSNDMTRMLVNFAYYSNPNGKSNGLWTPVTTSSDKVLRLGEGPVRMGKPSMATLIKTMLTNKAVGE